MWKNDFGAFRKDSSYLPYEYPLNHIIYKYQCLKCKEQIRFELRSSSEHSQYATENCVDCHELMMKINVFYPK